jgi:membrane protein YqaA with SNARE-associated domain
MNDELVIDGPLIRKTALGLFILLLFSGACAWLLKDPFIRMGEVFLERFGLLGLFVGTIIADTSPLPLTHEPLTFIGITAGIPTPTLLLTIASASILSGPIGWTCGRVLVADTAFAEWLDRRYPGFMGMMRRNGLKAVAIAALLPIPFSLATWTAGMLRLPFHKVAAISLLRIVKVGFYFQILKLGWLAGGG